jgi:A/G-specific adenine glycosylase
MQPHRPLVDPARSCEPIAAALVAWHAQHGRHDLPWQRSAAPIGSGCPRSCCSRRRSPPSSATTSASCSAFRTLRRWPPPRSTRCCTCGPDSAITHVRATCTVPRSAWSANMAVSCRARSKRWRTAGHRPIHGGGDRGAGDGPARQHSGWQRQARPGALLRDRGLPGRQRHRARTVAACRAMHTAVRRFAVYTQAIMDFGATLCTRRDPLCMHCPLREDCAARRLGRVHELPAPRVRRARPTREVFMLLAVDSDGQVLLQRRPPQGIWGGLWTPPEFQHQEAATRFCAAGAGSAQLDPQPLPGCGTRLPTSSWRSRRCAPAASGAHGDGRRRYALV